jgi:hypothetical protein
MWVRKRALPALVMSGKKFSSGRGSQTDTLESFSLTFTANVKLLTKFLILQLYFNSFYSSFEIY